MGKMKNYNLCISLNSEEKALITNLAIHHNKKPTVYAKDILLSIAKEKQIPSMYIPVDKMNYKIGAKDKCVKVYFIETEFHASELPRLNALYLKSELLASTTIA